MAQPQADVMIETTGNCVNITATEENKSAPKEEIETRIIEIPEEKARVFTCGDIVMGLQLASGAMIQILEVQAGDEEFPASCNRPVRLIGRSGNVDRAVKLIDAVILLDDAGGFALLHKEDSDSDDDQNRNRKVDKDKCNGDDSEDTQPLRSFGKRVRSREQRFRSHKRPCVPLGSKPRPQPSDQEFDMPQHPVSSTQAYNMPHESSGYAESEAYVMPQPRGDCQSGGYGAGQVLGMPQAHAYNPSSEYTCVDTMPQPCLCGWQAYGSPQPPPYNQMPQQSRGPAYDTPQPPAYYQCPAYSMPQPHPYNQSQPPQYNACQAYNQPFQYNQSCKCATCQAYSMPQPPSFNQQQPCPYHHSSGYTASYSMPQFPPFNY